MSSKYDTDVTRRRTLRTIAAGATVGGLLAAGSGTVAAQSDDLTAWFSNTDNAGSVTDRTGASEVTVQVGTDGNGAAFGFGPAVVRVDPGTTVVWEWTGEGGSHDVVATDGSFESELVGQGTFEHTFESAGVTAYSCTPHEAMGMKGAVVVGDADVDLGGGGGGGGGGSGGGGSTGGSAGGGGSAAAYDYGDWFANVGNFDGTVDATGQDEVHVTVGAEGNGGPFAFEPAAVRVDPGTTVVWEWTGDGGQHDVAAEDPAFESQLQSEAGATYGVRFDGVGIAEYACTPHEAVGMKGAVVVGDPDQTGGIDWLQTSLVGLAGAIVASPYVASEVLARRRDEDADRPRPPARRE